MDLTGLTLSEVLLRLEREGRVSLHLSEIRSKKGIPGAFDSRVLDARCSGERACDIRYSRFKTSIE